jgi:cytochrome c oxidase subunit 1
MAHETGHAHAHEHHDHTPKGPMRWLCSTNHKDIGTMYLCFSMVAALIGGLFSVIMRMELQSPGVATPGRRGTCSSPPTA